MNFTTQKKKTSKNRTIPKLFSKRNFRVQDFVRKKKGIQKLEPLILHNNTMRSTGHAKVFNGLTLNFYNFV